MIRDLVTTGQDERYARWIKNRKLEFLETSSELTRDQIIAIANSECKWLECFGIEREVLCNIADSITDSRFGGIGFFIKNHPEIWEEMMSDNPNSKERIELILKNLNLNPVSKNIESKYESDSIFNAIEEMDMQKKHKQKHRLW